MQVKIPYKPRLLQAEMHQNVRRWNVLVMHRRFGKTVWAVNHLIKHALTCELPRPRVAFVAPTFTQAKRIAWDYVKYYAGVIPGVSFNDLTFKGHHLDEQYQKLKYGCKMHGVGLCDEWPLIAYPDKFVKGAFDYVLEPGMVLCVEALVSPEGGNFSIKLEDQVLITENGYENLTNYPFDENLLN